MTTTHRGRRAPPTHRERHAKPREPRLAPRDRAVVIAMIAVPRRSSSCSWCGCRRSCRWCCPSAPGTASATSTRSSGSAPRTTPTSSTIYPPFWPAIRHNLIWLGFLFLGPTLLGMLLAVVLDRNMRGSRFYQTAFYMPVVLSLALVGFIWQLFYSRDQGLINQVFNSEVDWYGDSERQPVGRAGRHRLAAHRLHHADLPGRPEGRRRHPARGRRDRRRERDVRRSSRSSSR